MARYAGPIVDVDIHHGWQAPDEMMEYLPQRWRDYINGDGRTRTSVAPPSSHVFTLLDAVGLRLDARPPSGPPGSDAEKMREQVFDCFSEDYRGVMTFNIGAEAGHVNPYLSAALCSAINEWNVERWLPQDERFFGCLLLPSNNVEAAVAEIHRLGNHPRMVGVLFPINPLGRPLGDPAFHPIYQACIEHDLSLDLHVNSADAVTVRSGVGTPGSYIEHSIRLSDPATHYLTSFIVNGVFEKFPDLRVLVKEYGTTWLPHMIWKLDRSYDLLRLESPWVKKRPWDYIHSNIKFSTQPLEVSKDDEARWVDIMSTIDGIEDILCFSSDYPHYQFDHPLEIARMLPKAWVEKIMFKNSCELFNWPVPEYVPPARTSAAARG